MAKECTFDIVSSVDIQEVDKAFQQTKKEMTQRYDLKGSGSEIALDKGNLIVTVVAPSDFVAKQVIDIFNTKLIRRGIDIASVQWSKPQNASGGKVKLTGTIVNGIDKDLASKIAKDIRNQKFKAKPVIEGDKIRVSSTSKDELQAVIAFVKENDYGQPLQFVNYR